MAEANAKKEAAEESKLVSLFGKVSAGGLTILGIVYVMGFVVVNGYQVQYMNYSASALQLKHLAAGMLYAFLTFIQVAVVAIFLLYGVIDLVFKPEPEEKEKPKVESKDGEKGNETKSAKVSDRVKSALRYLIGIFGSLFAPYFLIGMLFQYIGLSVPPTGRGSLTIVKAMLPWTGINLGLSIGIMFWLYIGGTSRFRSASEKQSRRKIANTIKASDQHKPVTSAQLRQLRRTFIEQYASRVVVPLGVLLLLWVSLVFFQSVYARLKPDYGGGALYRVAVHLKPSRGLPDISTPKGGPPDNSAPDKLKEKLQSNDSWLLLVDKDVAFVYVLRVDRNNNKELLEISQGEIEWLEILPNSPVSPADAPFFMQ